MCNVWTGVANVAVHLPHDSNVLVAVQQRVLFILDHAWTPVGRRSSRAWVRGLVRFEAGIGKHHDQTASVLVRRGNGSVLRCD